MEGYGGRGTGFIAESDVKIEEEKVIPDERSESVLSPIFKGKSVQ